MRDEKGKKGLKFIFQGLDEINRHLWLCEENNVFYKDNGDFYPTKFYSCNGISFFGDLGIPLNIDIYNKLVVNEELNKIAKKYCERISSLQDLKNTHLNNNYIDLLIKLSGNS